jgi:hypothetical protein
MLHAMCSSVVRHLYKLAESALTCLALAVMLKSGQAEPIALVIDPQYSW